MSHLLNRREFLGCSAASLCAVGDWISILDSPTAKVSERIVAGSSRDFMIARHLRLEGSNFEIGRALARIAKHRHATMLQKLDPAIGSVRRAYFAQRYTALADRGRGVAKEFGISWQANTSDFFSLGYDGIDRPGCSTVYYPPSSTTIGHAVLSRNYDFTTESLAEMLGRPPKQSSRPFTGDPYVIEMWPDRGYPALYLCSYDLLAGCIDGINSKGLSVALLADDASSGRSPSEGAQKGLGEIEVTRFLLDTCASVEEAEAALKAAPQYYTFIPCHYIVGDTSGQSFVWEVSVPEGKRSIVEGAGKPQVVTNHLLSEFKNPDERIESFRGGTFNRYCRLRDGIKKMGGKLSIDQIKRLNESVRAGPPTAVKGGKTGRTLWHSLYDLKERTLEVDFYLGEAEGAVGGQKRSGYKRFPLG